MINVTKTILPPIAEYNAYLEKIWESEWITNRGALVLLLEQKLKIFLEIDHVLLMNNGTIPLQIALKILCRGKEVITSPFSYVATTSSIVWEGFEPVFVDIDAQHLTIDETKIEASITKDTGAILATHVFGNPCHVDALQFIGEKYDLPIIYDAAHAFGVKYREKSLLGYGDASTCSFHATKLFHTGEGGAIVSNKIENSDSFFHAHNFGHDGHLSFHGLGINGKMSELSAGLGLANLPYFDFILSERKSVVDYYNENLDWSKIRTFVLREGTEWNYSYFPIIFDSEENLIKTQKKLNIAEIFPRRYFYPGLNKLPYVNSTNMPVAEQISESVMCLPLYVGLTEKDLETIVNIINKAIL